MKSWIVEHKIYAVIMFLLVFAGVYYFYGNDDAEPISMEPISSDSQPQKDEKVAENQNESTENPQPEHIIVDVKGQVKQPGVYQSTSSERVIDVISKAGGLTDQADQTQVNLAEHVQDEMVIYIPSKGEEGVEAPGPSGGSTTAASGSGSGEGKINLNKADEQALQNLPGIGPAKAAAIIEYRNTNGSYKTVEDLKNVSGIGDKTFEKLKDLIAVK